MNLVYVKNKIIFGFNILVVKKVIALLSVFLTG